MPLDVLSHVARPLSTELWETQEALNAETASATTITLLVTCPDIAARMRYIDLIAE